MTVVADVAPSVIVILVCVWHFAKKVNTAERIPSAFEVWVVCLGAASI